MKLFVSALICYFVGVFVGWTVHDITGKINEDIKRIDNELKKLRTP